jgi:hypothetical protein
MKNSLALSVVVVMILLGVFLLARPRASVAAAQSVESGGASADSLEQQVVSYEREGLDALISEKGVSHGKEFTAQAYVSSIWMEGGGKWLCLFSQETGAR